jgi:CubicO group peptidase (beta-lactamase class C family)
MVGNAFTGEEYWVGAGLARPNEAVTRNDAVRWGSNGKLVGGLLMAMAVDDELFKLDDPVALYIPEMDAKFFSVLKLNVTDGTFFTVPAVSNITVRHVMDLTAGITYEFVYDKCGTFSPIFDVEKLATNATYRLSLTEDQKAQYVHQEIARRMMLEASTNGTQAGYTSYTSFNGCVRGVRQTNTQKVRAMNRFPLYAEPGTYRTYQPSYDLLGGLITGGMRVNRGVTMSSVQYAWDRIFTPLNMTSVWYGKGISTRPAGQKLVEMSIYRTIVDPGFSDPSYSTVATNFISTRNTAYYLTGQSFIPTREITSPLLRWCSQVPDDGFCKCDVAYYNQTPVSSTLDPYAFNGATDLVATLSDYAKLMRLVANNGKADNGARLVSPNLLERIKVNMISFTPYTGMYYAPMYFDITPNNVFSNGNFFVPDTMMPLNLKQDLLGYTSKHLSGAGFFGTGSVVNWKTGFYVIAADGSQPTSCRKSGTVDHFRLMRLLGGSDSQISLFASAAAAGRDLDTGDAEPKSRWADWCGGLYGCTCTRSEGCAEATSELSSICALCLDESRYIPGRG